jgi:hypothetical protein
MRMEVGSVNRISQGSLALAAVACGFVFFTHRAVSIPSISEISLHFFGLYFVTFLSFAAFPKLRRVDIVKGVVLLSILVQLAGCLLTRQQDFIGCGAGCVGALAVLSTSFIERFRSVMRADKHESFSMVYPGNRRRRARSQADSRNLNWPQGAKSAAQR